MNFNKEFILPFSLCLSVFFELLSSFNTVLTVHFNSGFSDSSKFFPLGTFIIGLMVFGGEYTVLVFHIAFVY